MRIRTILAIMVALAASTAVTSAHNAPDAGPFEHQLNALTLQIRSSGETSLDRIQTVPLPQEHPWGGAVWLHDGFVTIDKAELGLVDARRPSFSIGFQHLPELECRRMLSVRGGTNIAGSGVLQVSARNVETGRFVSFKGANLDTTQSQVGIACDGDLFTVTVSFDFDD